MKIVSNDFKTKVNEFGRQLDVIITYDETTLTRDNIYGINPNFHTDILKTLMKCVEVEADTLIPIGTRFNVQAGVKVGNAYEYIDYGYYTVKSFEKDENEEKYTMVCYDDMMATMVEYNLSVNYPITVKNLLTAICTHFNYTLDTATFVNDDTEIKTDVFSNIGMTYRDVLDELAIATCSTIEIENETMYLKYPTDTGVVINEDILNDENVTINKKYGPVNSLVLSRINGSDSIVRQDSTSIENDGLTELKIEDKQIFSTTDRDDFIDEMFNYLDGFEYYIYDIDTQGMMYLEATDKFTISVKGNTYPTILLEDETEIGDGLNEEMFVNEPKVTETDYKYTSSSDKGLKQAYITIDKQNGIINSTVQEVQTYDGRITDTNTAINSLSEDVGGQLDSLGNDLSSLQRTVQTNWEQTATSAQLTLLQKITGYQELDQGETLPNDFKPLTNQISEIIDYVKYALEDVTNPITGETTLNTGVVTIGKSGNPVRLKLANDIFYFEIGDNKVAYIGTDKQGNSKLHIVNAKVLKQIQLGNFAFIPRTNGSLSFRKVE